MRNSIQKKLSQIENLECGPEITDDLIVEGLNYFHYSISENYLSGNFENKNINRISFTGYLKRKKNHIDNSIYILDKKADEIILKLKDLNFKCSSDDVSINDNISKIKITGYVYYSEINKELY